MQAVLRGTGEVGVLDPCNDNPLAVKSRELYANAQLGSQYMAGVESAEMSPCQVTAHYGVSGFGFPGAAQGMLWEQFYAPANARDSAKGLWRSFGRGSAP
eukprot:6514402-Pyramimonas_sp.AAC.1